MLMKEYRICMPLSVEEYRIGQLYMIAKHSHENSENGEGIEVVKNEPCDHPVHGKGQYTEKRIHLSSRLPSWMSSWIPAIFYITEKAWNCYPHTITEYSCSFVPKFSIEIETTYEDNTGTSENALNVSGEHLSREVVHLDIAYDEYPEKHYKEKEDPTKFKSEKTNRGPLEPGWKDTTKPVMCSYKLVKAYFEVYGFQTKVEQFTQNVVKDILLVGHRQAFAWIDEWFGMSMEELREYEKNMNKVTNEKIGKTEAIPIPSSPDPSTPTNTPTDPDVKNLKEGEIS